MTVTTIKNGDVGVLTQGNWWVTNTTRELNPDDNKIVLEGPVGKVIFSLNVWDTYGFHAQVTQNGSRGTPIITKDRFGEVVYLNEYNVGLAVHAEQPLLLYLPLEQVDGRLTFGCFEIKKFASYVSYSWNY